MSLATFRQEKLFPLANGSTLSALLCMLAFSCGKANKTILPFGKDGSNSFRSGDGKLTENTTNADQESEIQASHSDENFHPEPTPKKEIETEEYSSQSVGYAPAPINGKSHDSWIAAAVDVDKISNNKTFINTAKQTLRFTFDYTAYSQEITGASFVDSSGTFLDASFSAQVTRNGYSYDLRFPKVENVSTAQLISAFHVVLIGRVAVLPQSFGGMSGVCLERNGLIEKDLDPADTMRYCVGSTEKPALLSICQFIKDGYTNPHRCSASPTPPRKF